MQRFICAVPVSPLRVQASHPSEMVSQLLFGETCTVLDSSNGDWLKVKCDFDQYEGFCQQSHLLPFAGADFPGSVARARVASMPSQQSAARA